MRIISPKKANVAQMNILDSFFNFLCFFDMLDAKIERCNS